MTAKVIDGRAFAAALQDELKTRVAAFRNRTGITPGLAVVIVGDNPASQIYVRSKVAKTEAAGMRSFEFRFPENASESEVLAQVEALNRDTSVHGILVQLPLPKQISEERIIQAIDPAKDVDGFHLKNVGMLATGTGQPLIPCTPKGCLLLLKDQMESLEGKNAVVVGRSNIVGKPMAQLLLGESATVTICHSRTRNPQSIAGEADILIAAVGVPKLVGGDWIKPGAVVIDVGINRISGENGKSRLVGDVDFEAARTKASAITPVPGGVGPMTIACLLSNTLEASEMQAQDQS